MQPKFLAFFLRRQRRPARSCRQFSAIWRKCRLTVEMLEGRCLPSTITVTDPGNSGPGTLRQAIMDASSGDTINFQSGLASPITLTTGELAISKNLTITGPGAAALAVSGNNSSRVFDITGSSVTVVISGLTMTNGYYHQGLADPHGGGAIFNSASLTVSFCTFTGNGQSSTPGVYTDYGGAIENDATLTIGGSIFRSNDSYDAGGAIYNFQPVGNLNVTNTTFDQNFAYYAYGANGAGGAIYNLSGSVSITASTFSNNRARDGGAILDTGSASDTVLNSTFSGNTATGWGNDGGEGGAISSDGLTVTSSTFNGNYADSGAMYPGYGGGIYGGYSVENTIIAGNSAAGDPDVWGNVSSLGHNLIGDIGDSTGWNASNGDILGTATAPVDPKLNPLANYGGPTQTQLPKKTSPAIGAGDPTDAPQYDQRGPGYPRLVNGEIDIGSVERQPSDTDTHNGPEIRGNRSEVKKSASALTSVLSAIRLQAVGGKLPPLGESSVSGKSALAIRPAVPLPGVECAFSEIQQFCASSRRDRGSLDTFFHVFAAGTHHGSDELVDIGILPTEL